MHLEISSQRIYNRIICAHTSLTLKIIKFTKLSFSEEGKELFLA